MATMTQEMAKQPKSGGRKESRLEIRAEQDWMDRVERQANRFGLSVTAYIRLATTERVERDESTDPGERD